MANSDFGKVTRAKKHIVELEQLLEDKRPFSYMLRSNLRSGERSTYAKRNEVVVNQAAEIAADVIHNLRTALDHAYWEIVAPFATNDKEEKAIQFPFSKSSAGLENAVKSRLADRVSPTFFQSLLGLKAFGEYGGNQLLYAVHELDALDKHRFPIPTGDFKTITFGQLREIAPDVPRVMADASMMSLGEAGESDILWVNKGMSRSNIGNIVAPTTYLYEKEIPIPVEIVFAVSGEMEPRPLVPTLNQMCDATKRAIETIRSSQ